MVSYGDRNRQRTPNFGDYIPDEGSLISKLAKFWWRVFGGVETIIEAFLSQF